MAPVSRTLREGRVAKLAHPTDSKVPPRPGKKHASVLSGRAQWCIPELSQKTEHPTLFIHEFLLRRETFTSILPLALRTSGQRCALSANNMTNLRRRGYFMIKLCTADWKAGTDPRDYLVARLDDKKAQALLGTMKAAITGELADSPLKGFEYVSPRSKKDYTKVDWAPANAPAEFTLPTLESLVFSPTNRQKWTDHGADLGKMLINETVAHPPTGSIGYYIGPKPDIPESICTPRLGSGFHADKGIPGVTDEYLYASLRAGSASSVHQEDVLLFSANSLVLGHPKVWLITGPEHEEAVERVVERKVSVKRVNKDSQYVRHQNLFFNTDFLGDEVESFVVPQIEGDIEIYEAPLVDLIPIDTTGCKVTFRRPLRSDNDVAKWQRAGQPSYGNDATVEEDVGVDRPMTKGDDEEDAIAVGDDGGDNHTSEDGIAEPPIVSSATPQATAEQNTPAPRLPSAETASGLAIRTTPLVGNTILPASPRATELPSHPPSALNIQLHPPPPPLSAPSSPPTSGRKYAVFELALLRAFPDQLARDIMSVPEAMAVTLHPAVLARTFQLFYVSLFSDPVPVEVSISSEDVEDNLVSLYELYAESLTVDETSAAKVRRLRWAAALWEGIMGRVRPKNKSGRVALREKMTAHGCGPKYHVEKYLRLRLEGRASVEGVDGKPIEVFVDEAKIVAELGLLGVGLPVAGAVVPGEWFKGCFPKPKREDVKKVSMLTMTVVLQDYLSMTEPQRKVFAGRAGRPWDVRGRGTEEGAVEVVARLKAMGSEIVGTGRYDLGKDDVVKQY
ncbi:hypothetical protein CONLIGDRAFT_686833 [Coniochaeta ligniaria NRRL 30616]|uniref:JmjC domain-containing protein n=1 Tax=Coniochaeta ligniaria NRRL 30616 TaxID=1408157 RepID=A0A1J7IZM1_9PEZI|nr:hypothetical protein CONLIGDRAFT_686833 [Coniochaeta ligniaria NRRL 30616]